MKAFAQEKSPDSLGRQRSAEAAAFQFSPQAYDFTGVPATVLRKAACSCGGGCPDCQSQSGTLKVSQPTDAAEVEADHIAHQVMRMSASDLPPVGQEDHRQGKEKEEVSGQGFEIQRRCAEGGGEDNKGNREPFNVQRRAIHGEGGSASISRDTLTSGGEALPSSLRSFFEPRFGRQLSDVRLHTGEHAAQTATGLGARAFTYGSHVWLGRGQSVEANELMAHELAHVVQQTSSARRAVAFRAGEFAPSTTRGRTLITHELTHVAQQASGVIQRAPDEASSRSTVAGGGATPGVGEGIDVTFLVMTTMSFVPDVKRYVDRNLAHEASYDITNLDELFQLLEANADSGTKVRRIRIVSHGLVTGEVRIQNPHDATKHFVTPKDVAEYAKQPRIRAIVAKAMAPGAVVEFWGCSIGRSQAAGEAWSTLFGTTFRAQTETFRTGYRRFLRPAFKGEKGQVVKGRSGSYVVATHTDEIKNSPNQTKLDFLDWLGNAYAYLLRNGDIDPVEQPKRFTYMVDLFNRWQGDLRNIQITMRDGEKSGPIRPGDGKAWNKLWRTFEAQKFEVVTEKPEAATAIPDIPTDIPVSEPSEEQLRDLGLRVSEADVDPRREPAGEAAHREPTVDPLVMCRVADTSPAGSVFARVPFATDNAVVPARHDEILSFGATLGTHIQTTRVRVDGYASTDGPTQYNRGLACRRALNVTEALVTRIGVPPANITSFAHDETSEFSPGDRAANRIVLISTTPAGPGLASAAPIGGERATSHLGPHLLAVGADAARRVAKVMPRLSPIVVPTWQGDIKMVPGTIWDGNKMLVWATPMTTYYVIDDRLYEVSTGLFLRTFWIDAFAKGVKRAAWLEPIAKVEMALLTGLFVPWQVLLSVTIVDTALTYYANREAFNRAFGIARDTAGLLRDLRERYPHYFDHLLGLLVRRLGKEVADDFLRGVSAEDIAFFLGRLLRGIGGLTELTVRSLIGVAAKTAALVAVTHAPAIAVHGVKAMAESQIGALQEAMRAEGVTMTQEEARVLLRELQAHPDTEQRLLVLEATLSELVPAMHGLSKALAKKR